MGRKLEPEKSVRFVRDGIGFTSGERGRVVVWLAVSGGDVIHRVRNTSRTPPEDVFALHESEFVEDDSPEPSVAEPQP